MKTHFDLIVVGGGIMGTFHAYHATLHNKSVLLLEKDNFPGVLQYAILDKWCRQVWRESGLIMDSEAWNYTSFCSKK
ncbi:MAG: FAD-dependent oxidoreductase [Spirosomataceae bacterium]